MRHDRVTCGEAGDHLDEIVRFDADTYRPQTRASVTVHSEYDRQLSTWHDGAARHRDRLIRASREAHASERAGSDVLCAGHVDFDEERVRRGIEAADLNHVRGAPAPG